MSSPSISTHPPRTPVDADVDMDDPETENDEEIDQLDSDTTEDEDVPTSSAPSSPTKARPRKAGERVPGHSIIPMTRIEDMLEPEGASRPLSLRTPVFDKPCRPYRGHVERGCVPHSSCRCE